MNPDPGLKPTREVRKSISRSTGTIHAALLSTTWSISGGSRPTCDGHTPQTESRRLTSPISARQAGNIHTAEVHWYEAHGIGRREMKIKFPLLD